MRRSPTEYEKEVLRSTPVMNSAAVAALLTPRLTAEIAECFYVLCLDGRGHALAMAEVARGSAHKVWVDPQSVFRVAIAYGATSIVVAHNHPSGDPSPSPEDLATTRRLREMGAVLGIDLDDHVIVAGSRYASLLDLGVLATA